MAEKPTSTSYYQVSFGTIEVSLWADGRRSARVRLDSSLRSPPVRYEGEDDDSYKRRQEKYDDFTKYGRIRIHASDVMNLLDVAGCIRPDLSVTIQHGGSKS